MSRKNYKARTSKQNYQFVLTNQPGYFLTYLISVPSTTVSRKLLAKDDLDTWKWPKLFLHDGIRTTLDELAFELQLMEDKNYRHILEQLKPPSPKPTTAALNTGGTDNVVFTEPKIKAFRAMAGEWLYDYATDAEFTSSTSTLPGVKAHVSFESMEQDVVIWIKINRADEVLECLFPFAVATARSQEMAYSIADGDSEGEPWFYITGASVSAFARVCPQMNGHIAASQLRSWEISNGMMGRTDCVVMKKSIANPEQGLLRLRFSHLSASSSMNQMFNV
ncbi:hypothetical protein H9L39_18766 [Fusarium oxysporum f. sp. albedinis]|nr:hypothetical protein H9L39_18766 [Fusarium oxysporum f. sp. albedinis]